MKKFCLVVLFAGVVVFSGFPQSGVIREMAGDVQIKSGTSDFVPAQTGSVVSQDTIISTGFRSQALIEIGSTLITVRPLTRLSLAEIRGSQGTESLNVNLQAGRIRVDVTPPAGTRANVTIQSPVATASVRGTSFEMDTRNLSVGSGSVNWRDPNGFSMAVASGYSSSISDTDKAVDPIVIAESTLTPPPPVGSGLSGEPTSSSSVASSSGYLGFNIYW